MEVLAKEINELIKNSDLYKRYLIYKKNIEDNNDLKELENKMNELKKNNCKNKNQELTDDYYVLEKKYKNNPLVMEYENIKKDMYELLSSISDILTFK